MAIISSVTLRVYGVTHTLVLRDIGDTNKPQITHQRDDKRGRNQYSFINLEDAKNSFGEILKDMAVTGVFKSCHSQLWNYDKQF